MSSIAAFPGLLGLAAATLVAQEPAPAALRQALAAAVDLPTSEQRAAAAQELAGRDDVTLQQWLAACAAFAPDPAQQLRQGANHCRVELPVLGATERTDVYLYVPEGLPEEGAAPLLLWGHGAGGSGAREYLPWQATADRLGIYVLAPSATGGNGGWGFSPGERAAALAALRWARRQVDVDEDAVFVGGASRGGHMAWDLALRFPDRFAAVIPCIGGPRILPGPQNNLRYLENVAHLPIRDLQGAGDDPLLLQNLRLCFARLEALGAGDAALIEFADRGHDFDLGAVDWPQFLQARRAAAPERVVRLAARPDEARAYWCEITRFDRDVAEQFELRVDGRKWGRLDEQGQREYLLDLVVERTARLEVAQTAPGRFTADGRGVRGFRLLLTTEMLDDDGRVQVRWSGRTVRRKPAPSAAVLLGEFVERFDRRFLPTCEVTVP